MAIRKSTRPHLRGKSHPTLIELANQTIRCMGRTKTVAVAALRKMPAAELEATLRDIADAAFSDAFNGTHAVCVMQEPAVDSAYIVDGLHGAMRLVLEDRVSQWARQNQRPAAKAASAVAESDDKAASEVREFRFPEAIEVIITEDKWRVREALAVAKLLSEHLTSPPGNDDDDDVAMLTADALARLLGSVGSFNDAIALVQRAERAAGVANDR